MKNKITGEKYYTDECKKRLKTLQQNIFLFADISSNLLKAERLVLMGLSYDYKGTKVKANEWAPGDIREFEHALKVRMGDRLKACAWVFELQKNGHGHYHVAIYADGFIPFPDKNYVNNGRKYKRLWIHGSSNVDWKPIGVYYLARYVGKEAQKDFMNFPKHARAYGIYFQDPELKKKFRDAITIRKGLKVGKIYKAEGWESDIEYLGSGYKLEYLKTVFGDR